MDADVIVAGGGPVGLMLACELTLAGVDVIVVERLTEPDTTIKAGAINAPTIEAFYRRGLLPALREAQATQRERFERFMRQRPAGAPGGLPPRPLGHYAGIMLDGSLVDDRDPDFTDRGPIEGIGMVPQQDVERILGEWAGRLGVDVRRGIAVANFDYDEEGVTVAVEGPGGTGSLRAGWLVGCDGGRSTVRRLAAFPFPGTEGQITGHQALVEMTGDEELRPGWNRTDTGVYVNGPLPGRILTVEFDGPPADREAPVTAQELQTSLRRVSGVPVKITAVRSATRFTDNARQVSTYRLGRVLLAGDAAHVHSPFGAQGLNLGIGDAVNLGWKLAATVRGRAPKGLLDTYTAERHPIGAWVLDWTRSQVLLMRPDAHSRALRSVVADLMATPSGTTYFVKRISGVWHHYDVAPREREEPGGRDGREERGEQVTPGGPAEPAVCAGAGALLGRSAPDLVLADGTRLADHCHDGRALLLDLADDPAVREAAAAHADRVNLVTTTCEARPWLNGLLVRPDGVVAWAGGPALGDALERWLGPALV
ncbi:FAD-dependent monooxygenase [Streptomyces sp. ICBB 8177]|uniref:FAD-dependent monooxygenase n=1 Tax=Streptomyces sp. ICBB 8177 TaxID=563922 RepID=UPI000D680F1D|nr:FAD-dependent monooxygenase [Streptomyces sp. ICBB 8177]PWI45395.1 FAD-dependent oxidoreductase [Streptomyces sp. ICBB 8177]